MRIEYSTDAVEPGDRFAYWNDVVCKHFIPAASHVPDRADFQARFAARSLGALTLGEMASPRHDWERGQVHLRRGPNEDFMLSLMVAGHGVLRQSGRELAQQAGDIVLYDAARPFSYAMEPRSVVLLRIPRKQLLYRVPSAERLTATRIAPGHAVLPALVALLRSACVLPDTSPEACSRMASALLEMLAVVLHMQAGDDAAAVSAHEELFSRAHAYMSERLDEPGVYVGRIAHALNISARTLMRVFAERGTTPMQTLWQLRLEASHCALTEGRVHRVTEAAFQYGFSDLSHYSRVFKRRYGITPRQALRRT